CLDDNARALLMVVMAYRQQKHLHAVELLPVYLSYIHYMQNDDGTFRNFLSFSRNYLDEVGSEDSFGRTIWALGYLLRHPTNEMHYQSAKEIFLYAAPNFDKLRYIRGIANTMIGLSHYLDSNPAETGMKELLRGMAYRLADHYKEHSKPGWKWFEPVLTYDNAVLPLSLLQAAEILADENLMMIAKESMDFLSGICLRNGYLSVIGNEKWFSLDSRQSVFAQQPIDAMMMTLMFQKAFSLTGDKKYLGNLNTSFMWFLGENDLQIHLYDRDTKGCFDGLESYGVNRNQGAESTLAYLVSHLVMSEMVAGKETGSAEENDEDNIPNYQEAKPGMAV
ncbi:MAG: glycosyltransferase, partial [Ferruginibacter sp.]